MNYYQNVLNLTCTAAGVFAAYVPIGFDDTEASGVDLPVKAVSLNPATEIGMDVAVLAIGTVRVKAVGAITKGAKIVTAVNGVSVAGATPANVFAVALTAAADGEFVTILLR